MTDNGPVIALTFQPDNGDPIAIELQLETFRPLIGELRLARPKLAATVEQAGTTSNPPIIPLHDGDLAALAVAARILREALLLEDPALEQLAAL